MLVERVFVLSSMDIHLNRLPSPFMYGSHLTQIVQVSGCCPQEETILTVASHSIAAARPEDFSTTQVDVRYDPVRNEACAQLVVVDFPGLELSESIYVEIELKDDHSAIQISNTQNFGIIEIVDDDGMFMLQPVCFHSALNLHSLSASCSFCSCWNRSGEDCLHYELYCCNSGSVS